MLDRLVFAMAIFSTMIDAEVTRSSKDTATPDWTGFVRRPAAVIYLGKVDRGVHEFLSSLS